MVWDNLRLHSSQSVRLWTLVVLRVWMLGLPVNALSGCKEQVGVLYKTLELTCSMNGTTFEWVKIEGNKTLTMNISNPTYVITDVSLKDEGIYNCTSTSTSETECTKVIVEYEPILMSENQDIFVNKDSVTLVECPIKGKPEAVYSWEKRGPQAWPEHVHQIGGMLVFGASLSGDYGEYICTATNKYKDQSRTLKISQTVLSDGWYSKGFFPVIWILVAVAVILAGLVFTVTYCLVSRKIARLKRQLEYAENHPNDSDQQQSNNNISLHTITRITPPEPELTENTTQTETLRETFEKISSSLKARKYAPSISYDGIPYVILPPEVSGSGDYEYVDPRCFQTTLDEFERSTQNLLEASGECEDYGDDEPFYENTETEEMYVNASVIRQHMMPEYLAVTR